MCTKEKTRTLSQLGDEKIAFPPNLTDGHTDRLTDLSNYRVASLLKTGKQTIFGPRRSGDIALYLLLDYVLEKRPCKG